VHQDPARLDQIEGFPDSGDQDWMSSHPAALWVSMTLTMQGFVGLKATHLMPPSGGSEHKLRQITNQSVAKSL
jgi:hypothetical protein